MATYTADVNWTLEEGEDFLRGRYSRGHTVSFDGGVEVAASASPHVVGKWAVGEAVDPEEMLVAALASCHMLSFLHVAREAGFTVAGYRDHAEGVMTKIAPGSRPLQRSFCAHQSNGRAQLRTRRRWITCTTKLTKSVSLQIQWRRR